MKRFWPILLGALALSGGRVSAAGSAGADPFEFLRLDANARAVAMGGAYTALATDANALLYNPSGLAKVRRHEATFMHSEHFQGVTQDYISVATRYGWGFSANHLSLGDAPRTTVSNPDGTGLGSAGLSDLALGLGYGRTFLDSWGLGVGLKYVREEIDGISAKSVAFDLGLLYSAAAQEGLTLGAAIQNLGPSARFQKTGERLPLNLRLGAAYGFTALGQRSAGSLDIVKSRSDEVQAHLGLETIVARTLPLRLGFDTSNDAGPGVTVGSGYTRNDLGFDYAFVPFGALGHIHRFSVTISWGKSGEPLAPSTASTVSEIATKAH